MKDLFLNSLFKDTLQIGLDIDLLLVEVVCALCGAILVDLIKNNFVEVVPIVGFSMLSINFDNLCFVNLVLHRH